MTRGYRILVLGDEGAPVYELRFSRAALWVGALALLWGCAAVAGAGYALASFRQSSAASAVPSERSILRRGLAQKASLMATPVLRLPKHPKGPCSPNMILIEGSFCPSVFHRCQAQTDPEGNALHGHRCAEYKQPAICLSPQKQRLRYCIDRDEYVVPGETLPQSRQTFADARKTCESASKRLCSNVEWTFACEGEMMSPYSYGFVRDSSICNADRNDLVDPQGELLDLRVAPGAFRRCQSRFGVRDLTGNLDEYVIDATTGQPIRKGGYWQTGANHCRLVQPHTDPAYRGVEVGFRCCADAVEGVDSSKTVLTQ